MSQSLFDKYGGFDTFTSIVSNFYQKVMDDDQVSHYFKDVNMDSLINHQTNFIAKALGGPDRYEGRDLRQAHLNLNITEPDFQRVVGLLVEALADAGVDQNDIETITALLESLQGNIVMS